MSVTEALRAATVGGAQALRAPDRGAMVRGRLADIVAWDADHEGAFAWSYGLRPYRVWRGGEPVTRLRPDAAEPPLTRPGRRRIRAPPDRVPSGARLACFRHAPFWLAAAAAIRLAPPP